MKVLVTGGTGFIGSHTCVELLAAGHEVVILDNLYNSERSVCDAITAIAKKPVQFYQGDIRDRAGLDRLFEAENIDAVIHFAGLKAVGESVAKPLEYYDNNITGTLTLLESMRAHGVRRMVFSSSATVYGLSATPPFKEDAPLSVTNPYGRTKLMVEDILRDLCAAQADFCAVLLRYFNPIGAHESGLIGENPRGIPNNLFPYINKVALRQLPELHVFGNDYDTPDGTGVRDYIHVVDLAKGHVGALRLCESSTGATAINLGTGTGYSVLDIVHAFEKANGISIPYVIDPRRPGDVAVSLANPDRARQLLGWTAHKTLEDMCRDGWNFAKRAMEA